jgi:beta-N-acetylhexosaminidase
MKPVIFGLAGTAISDDERAFFRDANPVGYILFGRNIENRAQVRALTDSLRDLSGRDDVPILIDQEGGRVARMTVPEWQKFPAGAVFDALYDVSPARAIEAARLNGQAIGENLREVGITVDCHPLLDVRQPDTVDAIGDRALGHEPMRVAALGRAILDGFERAGVLGIVKHIPGHGRAKVDSHHDLPLVTASAEELETDLAPFRTLNHAPMAMTAHILYTAWDKERCASLSPTIINDIIRQKIGFDGLLFSDDLDMKALKGDVPSRARDVVEAGCDVALNCWGRMDEMVGIANLLGEMSEISRVRLDRALASVKPPQDGADFADLVSRRDALLAMA